MGGGRGMGRGMGGGMGLGGGRGLGPGLPIGGPPLAGPEAMAPGGIPEPAQGVETLKSQAEAMAAELERVNTRIAELQGRAGATLVAVVASELCVACQRCAEVCPTGAVTVEDVARVDAARCNGCGRCVAACHRGAISLHKAQT